MRKVFAMGVTAALAVLVLAQVRGSDLLSSYAKALNGAKSVSATITVQPVGGTAETYKVDLAKPNLARIDSPRQLVVSDGQSITTFDKNDNSYYTQPYSAALMNQLLSNDALGLFAPFFNADVYAKLPAAKNGGVKNRKGAPYNVVEAKMDAAGKRTVSFYLDQKDNVAKLAEVVMTTSPTQQTSLVISTKDFVMDGAPAPTTFAFKAPEGAREVSLAELNAGKWYNNLDEAMAVAKKSHKMIFVDFMASWCGPCKMLDAEVFQTAEFMKLGKSFVFVKIDVDEQPSVAQAYKVTAMPTQMVLDPNGNPVGTTVGYGGPERFYGWITQYAR